MAKKEFAVVGVIAALLVLAGCTEQEPQAVEVIGVIALEQSECGDASITTAAGKKFYFLQDELAKQVFGGDEMKIIGYEAQKAGCAKILVAEAYFEDRAEGVVGLGDVVTIDYIEWIKETGELFNTSLEAVARDHNFYKENFESIEFVAGSGELVGGAQGSTIAPDVAKGVMGMKIGEDKNIYIAPENAFDAYDPEKVVPIDYNTWFSQAAEIPEEGTKMVINGGLATIMGADGNFVYVDFNDKYSGKSVVFWVKVLDIKQP